MSTEFTDRLIQLGDVVMRAKATYAQAKEIRKSAEIALTRAMSEEREASDAVNKACADVQLHLARAPSGIDIADALEQTGEHIRQVFGS